MSDDLVKRLRSGETGHQTWLGLCEDAADRIEDLTAERDLAIEKALPYGGHDLVKRALALLASATARAEATESDLTDIAQKGTRAITELEAQLAQRDAALKAADDLARAVESLTGHAWSTPIPNALAAYRKARGQDDTAH